MNPQKYHHSRSRKKFLIPSGLQPVLVLFVLAIVVIMFLVISSTQIGEAIPIMANTNHVPEGTDPNPYNSNPPTSGIHYTDDLKAGFYEENMYEFPEGYLVHNLEHGYVIFWYNCSLLDEQECENLKTQINDAMANTNGIKLIAYPWDTIDVPLVMTSWGRLLKMEQFDKELALKFIHRNLNKAPEPQAD